MICPVNVGLSKEEKRRILMNVEATIVVSEDDEPWDWTLLRKRDIQVVIDAEELNQVVDPYDAAIDRWERWSKCGDKPWMILSTSGTSTGTPKGVVRSQNSSVHGFKVHTETLGFCDKWTALMSWPLHSISSAFFAFNYLDAGMRIVMQKGLAPETFRATFAQHDVHFLTLPCPVAMQIDIPDKATVLLSGTMTDISALRKRWPEKVRLFEAYGSTEAGIVLLSDAKMNMTPAFPDSVKLVPLENGQLEILTRSLTMFSSYWKNPSLTTASFVDGYFMTADIGEQCGRYIRVCGRKDDMLILPSGQKIFPAEIENVLGSCCVVLGLPCNNDAQKLICVYDEDDETELRLRASQLGSNRRPVLYQRVSSLPRTAAGKVVRSKVRLQIR